MMSLLARVVCVPEHLERVGGARERARVALAGGAAILLAAAFSCQVLRLIEDTSLLLGAMAGVTAGGLWVYALRGLLINAIMAVPREAALSNTLPSSARYPRMAHRTILAAAASLPAALLLCAAPFGAGLREAELTELRARRDSLARLVDRGFASEMRVLEERVAVVQASVRAAERELRVVDSMIAAVPRGTAEGARHRALLLEFRPSVAARVLRVRRAAALSMAEVASGRQALENRRQAALAPVAAGATAPSAIHRLTIFYTEWVAGWLLLPVALCIHLLPVLLRLPAQPLHCDRLQVAEMYLRIDQVQAGGAREIAEAWEGFRHHLAAGGPAAATVGEVRG